MKLHRDSERVSPTGNIAPSGILNQLGRPTMDLLAVLVREAVQNSWDARLSDAASVLFRLDGWVLSAAQRTVLSAQIFADCPSENTLPLAACLHAAQDITVLAVSDSGTTGLGGPTRADVVTRPDDPRDFVDFLRDVGQPQQKQFAGGTYGYGKAIFYRISSVKTICVYTRCLTPHGPESRFTAAGLGDAFTLNGVRYTGRHWWGEYRSDVVEPILNADADRMAAGLGLHVFGDGDFGTTIVIIQPRFDESTAAEEPLTPHQASRKLTEYLLLYCWPKMLSVAGAEPPMRFGVSWQGEPIPVPNPVHYPPLQGYVQAMQRLKSPDLPNSPFRHATKDIASQRPAKHIGRIALQQVLVQPMGAVDGDESRSSPLAQLTHHTALMRQPELIVNYVAGPAPASPYVGYAGVFLADAAVDSTFAASEPPTHDAWVREALEARSERIYVNTALKYVDREMAAFANPPQTASPRAPLTPLGAFASMIGDSLAPAVSGPTARAGVSSGIQRPTQTDAGSTRPSHTEASNTGTNTSSGASTEQALKETNGQYHMGGAEEPAERTAAEEERGRSTTFPGRDPAPRGGRAHVRALSDGDFVIADGRPALKIPFTVTHAPQSKGTLVHAAISAVLDGGQLETEPPIGASRAEILHWIAPDNSVRSGPIIFVSIELQGTWHVVISAPSDIVLSVELRATARTQ